MDVLVFQTSSVPSTRCSLVTMSHPAAMPFSYSGRLTSGVLMPDFGISEFQFVWSKLNALERLSVSDSSQGIPHRK